MRTLNGQELEIFRAGNYGDKGIYTPKDLQQLATDYDPAKHEAPICVGHPAMNAPAFGWMKKLRASGDLLFGTPGQVDPAFDSAVQAGKFKKRSVALLRGPDGKLQLRHVGFLGAMPPEVLGLKDATFSSEAFEEIEFSATPQGDVDMAGEDQKKPITEALTEFFAKFTGAKPTETQAQDLTAMETRLRGEFSSQITALQTENATLRTDFASQTSAGAAAAKQRRIESVIGTLKGNRKWVPAFDAMGVPEIFAALGASSTQEIEFSSGTGSAAVVTKLDPIAAFAKFLEGLPKLVPEGVTFSGQPAKTATVPAGAVNADPASVQFDTAVKTRAQEKSITYNEALSQLRAEGVSNETFGSASAGEV